MINEISFTIFGDFNRYPVEDILDSYGALPQVVTVATRKDEILDLILTDLHTEYHAPVTLKALEVDSASTGKDSDHKIVVFPPIPGVKGKTNKKHKIIKIRPLSQFQIKECGKIIGSQTWEQVYDAKNANEKVNQFHSILKKLLDEFFPEKSFKISMYDKKWFSRELKSLHRKKQREYVKNGKSCKWKKLNTKFKKLKKLQFRIFIKRQLRT